jgi:hypothetical protein
MTQEATVIATADGVKYARLASLKGMLKLEKVGLKTRGGALRPRIAEEFGLNKRDPHDKFIAEIQSRMDAILAARQGAQQ